MTIDAKCSVCKNAERRRLIELGWNGGMTPVALSDLFAGISTSSLIKHFKEHSDGNPSQRRIDIEPVLPARDRILALQQLQLNEVERRIGLAKTRAAQMNKEREGMTQKDGEPWPEVDWSDFYDVLDKNSQAAIGSILKTQGLSDKRDKAQGDLKLGLFEAMVGAGLAPKSLVSGKAPLSIPAPDDEQDEMDDGWEPS